MKVLHVVSCLVKADGHSQFCMSLAERMSETGSAQVVFTLPSPEASRLPDPKRLIQYCDGSLLHLLNIAWPVGAGRQLAALARLFKPDVVHLHGGWHPVLLSGARVANRLGVPILLSLHGSLRPAVMEGDRRFRKRLAWGVYQQRLVAMADTIHVSTEAERTDVARLGFEAPVVVVPNGIDMEDSVGLRDPSALGMRWPECRGKRAVLFLSRIHPGKGLDLLIAAWKRVAPVFPDWCLLIAGPDENRYESHIRKAVQAAGLGSSVTFCGPLFGIDKCRVMAAADLFVLPTRSENFGAVVAEALACGVPVITTKGAPWAELLGNEEIVNGKQLTVNSGRKVNECGESEIVNGKQLTGSGRPLSNAQHGGNQPFTVNHSRFTDCTANGRCGWWVDVGADPLAEALKEAMGLTDAERQALGANGRRLVEEKYQWPAVAERMSAVYSGIVNREP